MAMNGCHAFHLPSVVFGGTAATCTCATCALLPCRAHPQWSDAMARLQDESGQRTAQLQRDALQRPTAAGSPTTISDADIERIAKRVAELLREATP